MTQCTQEVNVSDFIESTIGVCRSENLHLKNPLCINMSASLTSPEPSNLKPQLDWLEIEDNS